MKVTVRWLQRYVDFPWNPEQLAERLTYLGVEVEGVHKSEGEFAGVVVAEVLTREKHPNADRLSVCRVADGLGERQIVCGATNFGPGDKVPLILPGSSLPLKPGESSPTSIKAGKIRGVESQGMLCSGEELGLGGGPDGLWLLPADAPVGLPLAELLGRPGASAMLDLEITPNRPDLNSVIGIAREVAAVTGGALRLPATMADLGTETAGSAGSLVEARIDASEWCSRYTARVVRGVRVGPSPSWLREALESVGARSINNVVDVTNFVMLESGQPLHAFDLRRIAPGPSGRPLLVVRPARPGEKLQTLDGVERVLTVGQVVIADGERALALAGVIGGLAAAVSVETTDVLIESAWFAPANIRRTSKALGLRTEASYRFERGVDWAAVAAAGRRAVELIVETAGGVAVEGVVDAQATRPEKREITLRRRKVGELLGGEPLSAGEIDGYLGRLGIQRIETVGDDAVFVAPSWRLDLKREVDLIEEVCRLHGVERVASTPPRRVAGNRGPHDFDASFHAFSEARATLTALGLDEAQGQTLIGADAARMALASAPFGANAAEVLLANPLSAEMDALRPSLLPGLIEALARNRARREHDVRLFEIGRVFWMEGSARKEAWRAALAMTGARFPRFWSGGDREAKCDAWDLKGAMESFLERFGAGKSAWERASVPGPMWSEAARVTLPGGRAVGWIGQLSPLIARARDLRDAVWLAELDLRAVLDRRRGSPTAAALPSFPGIRRDASLIAPEALTHATILAAVQKAKVESLVAVDLFDVWRGAPVPEGSKSLAYAFFYRAADRTLKEAEIQPVHERLLASLRTTLGVEVRA